MKKIMVICAGLCVVLAFSSCKSKESAYKKAYEQAQAVEQSNLAEQETVAPVVTPVVERPVEAPSTENTDNVPVRTEDVTVVDGGSLRSYSVVVGAFGVRANADGLQSRLKSAGYNAIVVYNAERQMYRVVAATFDSKADAVVMRDQLRGKYADAWLLYKK